MLKVKYGENIFENTVYSSFKTIEKFIAVLKKKLGEYAKYLFNYRHL